MADASAEYREIVVDSPKTYSAWLLTNTLTFVLIHYLLWGPVVLGLLGLLSVYGGWIGTGISIACILAYLPTMFDGRHRRINSTWDAFRLMGIWRQVARYGNLTLIRTRILDPTQKYVMGWHPHGILILSRLAVYGGYFEGKRHAISVLRTFPPLSFVCLSSPQSCFLESITEHWVQPPCFTFPVAERSRCG
jgi:hypothetical protein